MQLGRATQLLLLSLVLLACCSRGAAQVLGDVYLYVSGTSAQGGCPGISPGISPRMHSLADRRLLLCVPPHPATGARRRRRRAGSL
jgi:hypothetical protein